MKGRRWPNAPQGEAASREPRRGFQHLPWRSGPTARRTGPLQGDTPGPELPNNIGTFVSSAGTTSYMDGGGPSEKVSKRMMLWCHLNWGLAAGRHLKGRAHAIQPPSPFLRAPQYRELCGHRHRPPVHLPPSKTTALPGHTRLPVCLRTPSPRLPPSSYRLPEFDGFGSLL